MTCNISPIPKDYCEIIEPEMDDKRPLEKFLEEDLEVSISVNPNPNKFGEANGTPEVTVKPVNNGCAELA